MKTKYHCSIVIILLVCFVSLQAMAQTNSPTGSFFSTLFSWSTSLSDLPTFQTNDTIEVWTAASYQNNVNWADKLGVSYNIGGAKLTGFLIESSTRTAGIAGTLVSQTLGGGCYITRKDLKLIAGLDGGYRFDLKHGTVEPFVEARKAMTENTWSGLRLLYPYTFGAKGSVSPGVEVSLGFKF